MALPARKLAHVPARAVTQDQLLRLVRFPAVRKAISGALTRAIPERADIPGARGRFIAFRVADPRSFHPDLYATIAVGSRGTLLRIGTPKSQIKKPRELSSFLSRMRRTLKTSDRKSLIYQLRSAGIIGGSRTQSVLVPVERVKAVAARFLSSPAAMRKVGTNPLLATMGIAGNPLTRGERDEILVSAGKDMAAAVADKKAGHKDAAHFWEGSSVGQTRAAMRYYTQKNPCGKNPSSYTVIFSFAGKPQSYSDPFPTFWEAKRYAKLYLRSLPGIRLSFKIVSKYVANPLTKKQMAVLRSADLHTAKKIKRGSHLWRLAKKPRCRPYIKVREPQYAPNVQEVRIPFRSGQTITPAQMRHWIGSLPAGPLKSGFQKRFEQSLAQYKKFHLGSEPKNFTYRAVPMGASKGITDVDFVVSEGKEWTAAYQVPSHSKKYDASTQGRYIHAHGESGVEIADIKHPAPASKLPERFHTADGKFVGVVPSRNVKIDSWYRG